LRKGDLVFFDTAQRGHVNHSGLYLGGGSFIHASSGKVYGVTISHLDRGFYARAFQWGVRVFSWPSHTKANDRNATASKAQASTHHAAHAPRKHQAKSHAVRSKSASSAHAKKPKRRRSKTKSTRPHKKRSHQPKRKRSSDRSRKKMTLQEGVNHLFDRLKSTAQK
jgi:hypothetical protein